MSAQNFRRLATITAFSLACSSFLLSQISSQEACPRPATGSPVISPAEIRSDHGTLAATLSFRTSIDSAGRTLYCYIDATGHQAPTLRVHPGDLVTLKLKNDLPSNDLPGSGLPKSDLPKNDPPNATPSPHSHPATTPCGPAHMTADSTNLHFHGLSIPPACHQDESLNTLVEPADSAFEYQFRIPASQPAGLYWYHPHIHGKSEAQVLGGASGALIVEGRGSTSLTAPNPPTGSLPERVFVIRDQPPAPDAEPGHPAKDLSVNFIPVPYPSYPMAILRTKPSRREFWRVLNACADTYLDLGVLFNGRYRQLGLVAVDGAPLGRGQGHRDGISWQNDIPIPPGGRAEFVIDTPAEHVDAELLTLGVDASPPNDEDNPRTRTATSTVPIPESDDANPPRQLVRIIASPDADETPTQATLPALPDYRRGIAGRGLISSTPTRQRKFYFSEKVLDPEHPATSTVYYITEQGAKPKAFGLGAAPDVTVHSGDVEDWVVENRSQESHAFHIHQLHFLTLQRDGATTKEAYLRDTIDVPYWDGTSPHFPSVKLRMDFRDPAIIGKFPYHCHVLQHADGGMMGLIEVKPKLHK